MSFVQGGGVCDTLATWLSGKRIDEEMSWTDYPLLHGGGRLDGQEFVHQGFIYTAAKLGQRFGQDKLLLRAGPLDRLNATGVQDGKVGASAVTDGLVRSADLVFEQLQREQYPG